MRRSNRPVMRAPAPISSNSTMAAMIPMDRFMEMS